MTGFVPQPMVSAVTCSLLTYCLHSVTHPLHIQQKDHQQGNNKKGERKRDLSGLGIFGGSFMLIVGSFAQHGERGRESRWNNQLRVPLFSYVDTLAAIYSYVGIVCCAELL